MKKKGCVYWITGLSGSGKTTLGNALSKKIVDTVHIDGDIIREKSSRSLGYDVKSRQQQIKRIQNQAKKFYDLGKTVIVSALYSNTYLLSQNRIFFENYIEIYLKVSIKKLIERDTKGLYSKFIEGQMADVVGMDIEWIEPQNPDFIFDNNNFQNCSNMVRKILG